MADYNPFTLTGKTILVTGGSSGIGKATAIECSKMGGHLIITGRDDGRLAETMKSLHGNGHISIIADLADESGCKTVVEGLTKIDGAVLCAGIAQNFPIQFCSKKKFASIFDINFFSHTELIRLLLKGRKMAVGGSVVAISSIASFKPSLGNGIYGASKAALTTFMKYSAQELIPRKIRFNCISPAMVETPLIEGGVLSDEQLKKDKSHYLDNRYGNAKEIAWGAIYLLSDAASWITGTNLVIDGGITI